MHVQYRNTLAESFSLSGVGIHTGQSATVCVSPNHDGNGIVFISPDGKTIPALYTHVNHTQNSTHITNGTHTYATIEHIVSALSGMGVHDATVTCDTMEIPIMDGASLDFVHAIQSVGIIPTAHALKYLEITAPLTVRDSQDGYITVSPYDGFYINAKIAFSHPAIGEQSYTGDITPHIYATQIAPARTFGFMEHILHYQKNNLARGATVDTAVLFDTDAPLNALRFADEPIRHKVLDIIGDIALIPYPIRGKITAYKMGHALNNKMLHSVFENFDSHAILSP